MNPRWLDAMRRHGYKGAFEMAATVDYLFGYDATTNVVADWMYEKLAETYVLDEQNRKFMSESNPWALHGISERCSRRSNGRCGRSRRPRCSTVCGRCTSRPKANSKADACAPFR